MDELELRYSPVHGVPYTWCTCRLGIKPPYANKPQSWFLIAENTLSCLKSRLNLNFKLAEALCLIGYQLATY